MIKLTTRTPWWEFRPVLLAREPFKTSGNLYSLREAPWISPGRLSREYLISVRKADYVVYSYGTPIAWHNEDGWHMPDVKYSVTTSRHQSRIRTALSDVLNDEIGAES